MAKVTGVNELKRNLQKIENVSAKGYAIGIKRASLFVQRKSMEEVPVDTGNLRGSAFARTEGQGFATEGLIGYTASYAIYVHENLEAAHGKAFNRKHARRIAAGKEHTRGPNQKAKFLTDPLSRNRPQILKIIADAATIRKI